MDIIKQCMENGESYVFRQKFNNLFSKEEFNHLLNLRPFTTVSRFLPTKRNKRLEYTLGQAKNLKTFQTNYLINQKNLSDFCTTLFNLMKNSKFKIN